MAAQPGYNVKIEVSGAAFYELPGQKTGSFERSAGTIDVTTKDDDGETNSIYGTRSWTFTADGNIEQDIFTAEDGMLVVESGRADRAVIGCRFTDTHNEIYTGLGIVASWSTSAAHDGTQTWNLSITGTDALVKT